MKVLAVAALALLGACCLEGAAVRREAEAPGAAASEAQLEARVEAAFDALELHLRTLSDYVTKELPDKLKAQEMKQQAKVYLERASQHFAPLAAELRTGAFELFSQLLDFGKRAVQRP
ncbi:apolipoprotein A-II [Apteryx mantelli]|uniref:Apolipoprotein A-II n=1 Tax=Apteryx mantelli TaxID=2696672 RepID=A0ABM4FXL1_9AVES